MACSFAPSLLVLATLIALVLPQLGLCAATLAHSKGQENFVTSLSTPTLTHEYEVFVSFRGEDTRTSFTAYLFDAFDRKRIRAYRDDKNLPRGREIGPELLKAIETSRIAVVVFSKNYATSSWCLDELVKIMECKRLLNQSVMPIFYEVSQSVVLEQKEIFAEALLNGPVDKVNNWRTALKEAANLEGFHLEPDRLGVGGTKTKASVEPTFLLGGFVWYPKEENAMSDNVSVGGVTGASVLSWSASVGCVGIEILTKGEMSKYLQYDTFSDNPP